MSFETKIKIRTFGSILIVLAGVYIIYFVKTYNNLLIKEFLQGFYIGTGFGLIGAGAATFIKNMIYLLNPEKFRKAKIEENDERNLYLWVHAGHKTLLTVIILLFISLLIIGLGNPIVFSTVLNILSAICLIYLIYYIILKRIY